MSNAPKLTRLGYGDDQMMTASECLDRAAIMDASASRTAGAVRAEYHALAEGWRFAARVAGWQDEWAKDNGN